MTGMRRYGYIGALVALTLSLDGANRGVALGYVFRDLGLEHDR
jgi:hypothetical protein